MVKVVDKMATMSQWTTPAANQDNSRWRRQLQMRLVSIKNDPITRQTTYRHHRDHQTSLRNGRTSPRSRARGGVWQIQVSKLHLRTRRERQGVTRTTGTGQKKL